MKIELIINGKPAVLEAEPHEFLTEALRRAGLVGTKRGCETGDCGACSVLLDGEEVPSCIVLAAQAGGHEVTTIEGLGDFRHPHPIQLAFVDATAIQCGYCTPGMVIATKACLDKKASGVSLSEAEARELLAAHVCRCTGYTKPIKAVMACKRGAEPPKNTHDPRRADSPGVTRAGTAHVTFQPSGNDAVPYTKRTS